MKVCKYCGTPARSEIQKFCSNCGKAFDEPEVQLKSTAQQEASKLSIRDGVSRGQTNKTSALSESMMQKDEPGAETQTEPESEWKTPVRRRRVPHITEKEPEIYEGKAEPSVPIKRKSHLSTETRVTPTPTKTSSDEMNHSESNVLNEKMGSSTKAKKLNKYEEHVDDREITVKMTSPAGEKPPVEKKRNFGGERKKKEEHTTVAGDYQRKQISENPEPRSNTVLRVLAAVGMILLIGATAFVLLYNIKTENFTDSIASSIASSVPIVENVLETSSSTEETAISSSSEVLSESVSSSISGVIEATSEEENIGDSENESVLASTQDILVEATGNTATLTLQHYQNGQWIADFQTTAAIGSNGITTNKTEGDRMTPAGTFPIYFVFSDKAQNTKLPFVPITEDSIWICDPNSTFYNTLQSKSNVSRDWVDKNGYENMYVKFSKKSSTACICFGFNGDGRSQYSANANRGSVLFLDGVGPNGKMDSGYGDIKISSDAMNTLLSLLDPAMNPTITIIAAN